MINDVLITAALVGLGLVAVAKLWASGLFEFKSNRERLRDIIKK